MTKLVGVSKQTNNYRHHYGSFVFRRLAAAEDEIRNLRAKAGLLVDYETQVRRLRDDIALLTGRRDALLRASTSAKDDIPSYRVPTPSKFKAEDKSPLG